MKLPSHEIGISDLLGYRDCPRRMSWSMKRHTPEGEPVEATTPDNAYGHAIHETLWAIEEDDLSDEQAILATFKRWTRWLDPSDLERLKRDIAVYRSRDVGPEWKTVLNEGELRMFLMEYKGERWFFRGKIDRLYQHRQHPGLFLHKDWKSSKWPKSEEEIDNDLQFWSYNLLIHDYYPECEELRQSYDMLGAGAVTAATKNAQAREQIREWLQLAAMAVIDDDDLQEDGLLKPSWNEWCPWCPLKMDCTEVTQGLTRYADATLKAIAPSIPILKKDGSPGKRTEVKLDVDMFDDYVRELPKVGRARQTMERFEKTVRDSLRRMPEQSRDALGARLLEKTLTEWGPDDLRAVHDLVGDDAFYHLVGLTKTSVESFYPKDHPMRSEVMHRASRRTGPITVQLRKDE